MLSRSICLRGVMALGVMLFCSLFYANAFGASEVRYEETFDSLGGSFTCTKDTRTWTSEEMDIEGVSDLQISVDVSGDEFGKFEGSDYLKLSYRIDGGSWVTFFDHQDDLEAQRVAASVAETGSTMEILIEAETSAKNETYEVDDLVVVGVGGGGSILYQETFDSLGGSFTCTKETRDWVSDEIDIGGASDLQISVDVSGDEFGKFEVSDYLRLSYRIDGGSWVTFFDHQDDLETQTIAASVSGTGSTMEILIEAKTSARNETYEVDNLMLVGVGGGGSILYQETFDSLGGSFTCTKETRDWVSDEIDIGGASDLQISLDVSGDEFGKFEVSDYLKLSYRIDGGNWVTFFNHQDDLEPQTIVASVSETGSKMEILIEARTSALNETYKVDNLIVSDGVVAVDEVRSLYPYSFGGIEDIAVADAVDMLIRLGYAGIVADAKGKTNLARLNEYLDWSETLGTEFEVYAAFYAHRIDRFGLDIKGQKQAIDVLAARGGGTLWVWVSDRDNESTVKKVEALITDIFDYATGVDEDGEERNVNIVLYPHVNNVHETIEDAMPLVDAIDDPQFTVAINLTHELHAGKGSESDLAEAFAMAEGKIGAINIAGAESAFAGEPILPINDSVYDLRPFMRLIRDSDFTGPVGFLNFQISGYPNDEVPHPEDYLTTSIDEWRDLCDEVGLFE